MQDNDFKDLDVLKERLSSFKDELNKALDGGSSSMISDSEMIKFNAHGQWSLNKEETPYWKPKAMAERRKQLATQERAARTAPKPAPSTAGVKPSTDIPYVNIPGKGRGEKKTL